MQEPPSFGPDSYVERFRPTSGLLSLVSTVAVAAFAYYMFSTVFLPMAGMRDRLFDEVSSGPFSIFFLVWVGMLAVGVFSALPNLYRSVRRVVAFAVDQQGLYLCPSGKSDEGEWIPWDRVSAIEFTKEWEGAGKSRRLQRYITVYGPGYEGKPVVRAGGAMNGWRVSRRKLEEALQRFSPSVTVT